MTVPYTFSNKTGILPLSELDANFATLANAVPALALRAGTVTQGSQPNITEIGTLQSLTVSGGIQAGTVTGTIIVGTLSSASQPNITQIGTLTDLTVSNTFTTNAILATTVDAQIIRASQPSVTSLGTLTNLSVSGNAAIAGNVQTGNVNAVENVVTAKVTANQLVANSILCPSISSPTVTVNGSLSVTGNVLGTVLTAAQPNITSLGTLTSLSVSGNLATSGLSANNAIISGTLTADSLTANSISGNLNSSSQTNITSVGTLTSLSVSGNISTDNTVIADEIVCSGNITGKVGGFDIGYRTIPQVILDTNSFIQADTIGKHYYSTGSSTLTLTIPNISQATISIGSAVTVINRGTGTINLTPGPGVQLFLAGNSVSTVRSIVSYGTATLIKVEDNIWILNGTGIV